MKRPRKIQLQNQSASRKLRYKAAEVRRLFHLLDAARMFPAPDGDLSIAFLDDEQISRVHEQFMNDPSPTDVITFPGDPAMDFAGEICVSVEHADSNAKNGGSFARELSLYLVHGYLHLAGFDDTVPDLKRKMRRAERKALEFLEKQDGLPEFK